MSLTLSSNRIEAIHRGARHLNVWLAATGMTYGAVAREVFVRAHPTLFGHAYQVTLRGYEHWRRRHQVTDTLDGFARYIARRHQRWIDSHGCGMAPCLVGTSATAPCWQLTAERTVAADVHLRSAA
jgi:hypothetical protein